MGHPIASEEIEKIEREINTREDLRGCSAGEERKREREKEREREREIDKLVDPRDATCV